MQHGTREIQELVLFEPSFRDAGCVLLVSGHDKPGHGVGAAGKPTPQVRVKQGPDPTLPRRFCPDSRRYAVLIFNTLGESEPYGDDARECGIEGACGKIGREWGGVCTEWLARKLS